MPGLDVREKVAQWLGELFKGVEEWEDGTIFVPGFGTTALFVRVNDVFDDQYVRVNLGIWTRRSSIRGLLRRGGAAA